MKIGFKNLKKGHSYLLKTQSGSLIEYVIVEKFPNEISILQPIQVRRGDQTHWQTREKFMKEYKIVREVGEFKA